MSKGSGGEARAEAAADVEGQWVPDLMGVGEPPVQPLLQEGHKGGADLQAFPEEKRDLSLDLP